MYDIKWIRENPEAFDKGLKRRGLAPLSQHLISIDERRRAIIRVLEGFQARRNSASKEIGEAKKNKDEAAAQRLMAEVAEAKTSIPRLEAEQKAADDESNKALAEIPNLPLDDVPDGNDETGNVEHHVSGKKRDYAFKPKQHFELGEALGMMDFELAAKLSGARFVVLQKGLARLERALGQFFLDTHTKPVRIENGVETGGYAEVNPPLLVRDPAMFGTAQLPKFEEDQYFSTDGGSIREIENYLASREANVVTVEDVNKLMRSMENAGFSESTRRGALERALDRLGRPKYEGLNESPSKRLWLIPTAEVPLTNLVRESIVEENTLPRRYTACTPCFRAEAGAAGKDTRGMIRQHQFTKVELVSITTPEKSKEEHERMLACAEEVLKKLDLHYRVITLCTGDMGFAAQKTYDIEVWLPGQNMYREISSCSVCGEFQARRMNARYRGKDGKPAFVHTLNGSGVAVGRALIAVMETYQQEDGSILVPAALAPYMGGMTKIERA
jgi:seryl-tRNA synthetase